MTHVTETVWVDDYLVRDSAAWLKKHRGVLWYEHDAFGRAVAEMAGLYCHSGGPEAEALILAERGDKGVVASIGSHGRGRNGLQFYFAEQMVANPPCDGKEWEQLLGRLHRIGQKADEVVTYVYRHTEDFRGAIDKAARLAKYIDGITSNEQKLLKADFEFAI